MVGTAGVVDEVTPVVAAMGVNVTTDEISVVVLSPNLPLSTIVNLVVVTPF